MTDSALTIVKPAEPRQEPWRRRLIRSLLYGRNVDRAAKARARVGFVDGGVCAIYAVIGGRLIMFAVGRRQPRRAPHRGAGRDRHRATRYRRSQRRGARH